MSILRLGIIFILLLCHSIFAHQQPSFPGSNNQPQAHHQAHAQQAQQQQQYQQQPAAAQQDPPANTQQFG